MAFEYSLVARPAYSGTDVDARADDPALTGPTAAAVAVSAT